MIINTPLGPLSAIGDEHCLYSLTFGETEEVLDWGSASLYAIQEELAAYFQGRLDRFTTPIALHGTPWQRAVWKALQQIPLGETRSYAAIARILGRPSSARAVATACAANPLAIIVPCHRVIHTDGTLGGYRGGIDKKQGLLTHEKFLMQFLVSRTLVKNH